MHRRAAHGVAGTWVMLRGPHTRALGAAVQGRHPRSRQGPSAPQPLPGPPSAPGSAEAPARTHLVSSSSGVSGHFAAKWAVTALDAEAVPEQSSQSQSTVAPRSSRITLAAFAMAQEGKRELIGPRDQSPEPPRRSRLLPTRRRPLPVGGARVRYSALAWHVPGACASSCSAVRGSPAGCEPRRCGWCRNVERDVADAQADPRPVLGQRLWDTERGGGLPETELGLRPTKAGGRCQRLETKAGNCMGIIHTYMVENKAY